MADKLKLRNMIFYGYQGAFEAEREVGQRFEVDVEITTDFHPVAQGDDLEAAINPVDVYTLVKELVEEQEFRLLESLAEAIAKQILDSYDVPEVLVRVRKPHVPLGGILDYVEAEAVRSRE